MGFFTIDRELLTHDLWLEKPFSRGQAWVDLIGIANHSDTKLMVRGKSIEAKRGEVNRSFRWLADRWGWSPDKVRRFVDLLETRQMVVHETRQGETVLTLCNYCVWQDKYLKDETRNKTDYETPTRRSQDTDETPTRHEQQYKQLKQNNNSLNSIQEINNKGEFEVDEAVWENIRNIRPDEEVWRNIRLKVFGKEE